MERVLIFLSVIASLLVLGQWFVFNSVRKYLFKRYEAVTRRTAYPVLAFLGLVNFLFVRLTFGSQVFAPGSTGQKIAGVVFFTYLGCVLALCLFFLLLRLAATAFPVKDYLTRVFSRSAVLPEAVPEACSPEGTSAWRGNPVSEDAATRSQLETDCSGDVPKHDCSRRSFLQWGAATGLTTAIVLAGQGLSEAYARPVVEEFDVFDPNLAGLDRDVTIIQITDFHFGMFCGANELERLVRILNSIGGDALVITGDFFHSAFSPMEEAPPILKRLKPRRYGNFMVLGNHDFYAGLERSEENIRKAGLTLLRDQWLVFEEGKARILLGGIDDPMQNWVWGKEFPRFRAFMAKAPKDPGMRVLLSHRPAILPQAAEEGIGLVLSGHIHGGQIIFPVPGTREGVSIARVASPYTHGWYKDRDCRMYLNRGVGLTFVPWRVNCPAEITVFHLKPTTGMRG